MFTSPQTRQSYHLSPTHTSATTGAGGGTGGGGTGTGAGAGGGGVSLSPDAWQVTYDDVIMISLYCYYDILVRSLEHLADERHTTVSPWNTPLAHPQHPLIHYPLLTHPP